MTQAKHIPEQGETFAGHVPAVNRTAHITFGASSDADVQVSDAATYVLWNVTEPVVVYGLWTRIETAFSASAQFDIGDTTTTTLFTTDTTILPQATGAVLIASTGLALPIVYAAGQDFVLTQTTATVSVGLGHVYIQYAVLED